VMNLVSLLTLPAIISLRNNDAARFTIAGVALVVLIGAVAFSKRKTESMAGGVAAGTFAAVGHDAPPDAAGREPKVEAALAHVGTDGDGATLVSSTPVGTIDIEIAFEQVIVDLQQDNPRLASQVRNFKNKRGSAG